MSVHRSSQSQLLASKSTLVFLSVDFFLLSVGNKLPAGGAEAVRDFEEDVERESLCCKRKKKKEKKKRKR